MDKDFTVFQKLCLKMVDDPEFAERVLGKSGQDRKEALEGFLSQAGFAENLVEALDDFIVAISKTDLEAMSQLRATFDGSEVRVPI